MPKRCFSKCRRIPQDDCVIKNKCYYTNGKTRKFCRLKHTYKMDKECNITRRLKKGEAPRSPSPSPSPTQRDAPPASAAPASAVLRQKQATAREVIARFMRKTKHKRKSEFFKTICSDSGVCIAFSEKIAAEIKKFFGGFTRFEYAQAPIKRIGKSSANGFVNEITYSHRGYKSFAVLKSSASTKADNLMYEYLAGLYVNKLNKQFSCFLETYGYYTYNSNAEWTTMKNTQDIGSTAILKTGLTLHTKPIYAVACKSSKYLAILIQHLKDINSMRDMLSSSTPQKAIRAAQFGQNELLYALYQVYMPLATVRHNFTHFDLHGDNVYLYEPVRNQYIQYHYHIGDQVVSFKSRYMAKIIDYGRSFFKDDDKTDTNSYSKSIYDELCKTAECGKRPYACGYNFGFGHLTTLANPADYYFIYAQKKNISHDLRLIKDITSYYADMLDEDLKKELQKVVYGVGLQGKINKGYGTIENFKHGKPVGKIYNVRDAADALRALIETPAQIANNEANYAGLPKMGDLYIYADGRPMRFVKG